MLVSRYARTAVLVYADYDVCVCVCVCMCACACVCVYMCVRTCFGVYMLIRMHAYRLDMLNKLSVCELYLWNRLQAE